ncbi:NAD(P)-binding protein [Candidatus Kaiserbacteria bacterium]|nr:NAD(P)-binding protein [Candidatus Kaiserbacteria bacterium]
MKIAPTPYTGTLIVVGSGISGIMTAWQAQRAGYSIEIFSKSPDPRLERRLEVEKESSTFDSKNDQRYVTIFEGHPYLELDGYVNKVYPGIANDFRTGVLRGGVLVSSLDEFSKQTQEWLHERYRLNERLLKKNKEDVDRVARLFGSYSRENRAAMEEWFRIMIELVQRSPAIVPDLSLHTDGIVRLYDNAEVFEESKASHKKEEVFIKEYTPQELVERYPAYREGVARGFIKGGAIEVYGLTFAVGTFCRAILDELEQNRAKVHFSVEAKNVVVENGKVKGLMLFEDEQLHTADNYAFHTGAFVGPELFESIPQAHNKLAAVEGYWITVENADALVQGMGGKPNKVHGKKSLAEMLGMVNADSAAEYKQRFENLGVNIDNLASIAPIVDFNNMPINKDGKWVLGVGSGYVFKGLAERGKSGKVVFRDHSQSEPFVLAVMELWLEALHGKELLGEMVIHPVGCKRSYTPDDKELDVNLPTTSGGICMIHDGGNTGSTTKSPFIAKYIVEKMKKASSEVMDGKAMQETFPILRESLGKTPEEIPASRWKELSSKFG